VDRRNMVLVMMLLEYSIWKILAPIA